MMRWIGAALAAIGLTAAMVWFSTVGSRPQAAVGSFDIPVACLGMVLVGLFVWMAGMARHDSGQEAEWTKVYAGGSSFSSVLLRQAAAHKLRHSR